MATVNLGRVGFVNKGNYTQSTNYKVNDVVKYGLEVFACITAHKSPSSGFDSSKWIQWVGNDDVKVARANIAVTVGVSGKDFTTVKAAIEYLSQFAPIYKKGGIIAEIKIEDGYILKEQLLFNGIDLSFIRISYEGSGYLKVDRDYLTASFGGGYPVFGVGDGANSPQLNLVFDCQVEQGSDVASDTKHGILVFRATANMIGTAGAVNCSGVGVYCYTGNISGHSIVGSSNKTIGVYALRGGEIKAQEIVGESDAYIGVHALAGHIHSGNLFGESTESIAIYSRSGTISAYNMEATSISGIGILCEAGSINGTNVNAKSDTSLVVYSLVGSIEGYTLNLENSEQSNEYLCAVASGGAIKSRYGTWTNNGSGNKCNVAAGTISSNGYVNRIG